jgi:iron complex outermembrane receptor protein
LERLDIDREISMTQVLTGTPTLSRPTPILALSIALLLAATQATAASVSTPATGTTLETVTVTAQRIKDAIEAEQAPTPGGVSVVDGESLYERSVTSMTDMLRYVPGVWAESGWGSDELFFSSRGSNLDATDYDKNGIELFQDGLPITTADGNNHNRVIDPLSARYVVIARGANALTFGSSTLGGAFDFTSPTARTTEPLSVYATGGSFGLLSGRVTAGGANETLDGLVTLEAKSYDGYRDHSAQDRKGVYANAGWQMSDSVSTRFYATYLDNDEELPRALTREQVDEDPDQAAVSAITGDNRKVVKTARGAVKTTWQMDAGSSLQVGFWYEDQSLYHPIVDVRGPDPDGAGPELGPQYFSLLIDTDQRNFGGMVRYAAKVGAHDLLFGVTYRDTDVDGGYYGNLFGQRNGLMEYYAEAADGIEGFAVDRWALNDAWTLIYGAQAIDTSREVRETTPDGVVFRNPQGDYSSVNPRIGVTYAISDDNEAFANVSRLYEPPTTFELSDDACKCNDLLDPMEGTVVEIGVRGSTAATDGTRWHWDVAAYYARIHDEILSVDDPEAPGTSLSDNIDSTIHAGVEALVGASFVLGSTLHRLEPLVSLTINEFSFDSDPVYGNNDLPAAPKYAARGEVIYRHASGFYLGPTFDLVGKRYADFANTYSVDSYQLLGLRSGYAAGRWEVFAELRNLLDEDYISTVSVRDRASPDADVLFPGAPLSAYIGGRLTF